MNSLWSLWGAAPATQNAKPYYLTERVLACVYGECLQVPPPLPPLPPAAAAGLLVLPAVAVHL